MNEPQSDGVIRRVLLAGAAARPKRERMNKRPRRFAPLSMIAALVIALFTAIAPTPAYASDTLRQEIINVGGGGLVDVMWASVDPYTGVFLWPNNTSASQEFDLLDSGNGFFRIKARHSNQRLMLDWRSGYYANGTRIIQYPYCYPGYAPAEWYIRWVEIPAHRVWAAERHKIIVNRQTGRCLDADSSTGHSGQQALLQQWDCITSGVQWNSYNQMWEIQTASNPPR
ncbi:RICIN domain-containing protein [Streptomyces sp. NBC_00868]|uniref:RICIN domain-containing protein n=1 Tax=Streptomyces sp. NBC_00868 TaxID=2903683 RepID=UPI003866E479|nr:RICIN domain-containing protein [Streptomyces sp. NBC_00868]